MDDIRIRVLLISPLPPPAGGIATWTQKYLDWSKSNNICVDVVNSSVIGGRAKQINTSINILDEYKRTMIIIRDLKNKIKSFRPNVVHLNTACGKFGLIRDYFCASIVKKCEIPLVVHYRCNIEDQINNNLIQKFFLRKLSCLARVNLVLNTPSKTYLDITFGIEGRLISNFIDNKFIYENKIINTKIFNIVFIGHVQRTKGVREIFEVASHFPEICFSLAGPISSEIKLLKIPKNVILKGQVNLIEVRKLLCNADVFLFPTYTEGFSNALLEAMAAGLPIITTDVGANGDMIESSGGILVQVKNSGDIIRAISKLENKDYREVMSKYNIEKIRKNYLIDIVMDELISIYETAIR